MFQEGFKRLSRIEYKIRGFLSRNPVLYAAVAGIGVILVWRGVWHTADTIPAFSGPISFVVGCIILLVTGAFVSSFVGNRVIRAGLAGEKKLSEKMGKEIETEISEENTEMKDIRKTLSHIEQELGEIAKK